MKNIVGASIIVAVVLLIATAVEAYNVMNFNRYILLMILLEVIYHNLKGDKG